MRLIVELPIGLFLCVFCVIVLARGMYRSKCTTENNEDGECVNLSKCYTLQNLTEPSETLINLERKKCTQVSSDEDLVCCKLLWEFKDTQLLLNKHTNLLPDASDCGRSDVDRITNGVVTQMGQFPWMVLMIYRSDDETPPICGGSLISNRYVVTAAHCINLDILGVRLGEWDLATNPDCSDPVEKKYCAPPVIDVGIDKIVIHQKYKASKSARIDIALIRMNQTVSFSMYVYPICLPTMEPPTTLLNKFRISGWGLIEDYQPTTKQVFTVVNLIDRQQCQDILKVDRTIKIEDTIICVHSLRGQDSCKGDSGGPLMYSEPMKRGGMVLAGIISAGTGCGSSLPSLYTNVYKQLDWILSNLEP